MGFRWKAKRNIMIYFSEIRHELVKGEARPAWTYRGARRNTGRESRGLDLKQKRLALGMSRSEFDRWRHAERMKAEPPLATAKPAPVQRSPAGQKLHEIRCRNGVGRPPKEKTNDT
jgi:hypothetical protein